MLLILFFLMISQPSCSTLFPYTTLFRSIRLVFPMLIAVSGALLLTHSHSLGNIKEEVLAELSHIPLAILGQNFLDRKSTRLNSIHVSISYAVFCLKKKINFTETAIH